MASSVEQIIALTRGHPGPFFEDDNSFFGRKRVDPSRKDARMETDCGGAMITKAPITYGEADAIAATADLDAVVHFVRACKGPACYWPGASGQIFVGKMWWAIYSYLTTAKAIPGNPQSYSNSMEYLYDSILKRLVAAKLVAADQGWRYFTVTRENEG